MKNFPLQLNELRLQCSAFKNREFTKFIPAEEFRKSLWNALRHKRYRAKFDAANSFDFDGKVLFGKQRTPRQARVHAVKCFKGAYFSVTFRCEEEPKVGEDSLAGCRGGRLLKVLKWDKSLPAETRYLSGQKIESRIYRIVNDLIGKKLSSGLLLISGATGSGKTTFLNVLFAHHLKQLLSPLSPEVRRRPHLLAIGDPVETNCYSSKFSELGPDRDYENAGNFQEGEALLPFDFTSRTLGLDVASVAEGLMDALRETPSAVVVSELRDDRDFRAALKFAATGHLIFATSHNTSLVDTFGKLLQVSGADTPGKRAALIQRLLAVVHLRKIEGERVPALWRLTPTAVTAFVAEGLSSLIAGGRVPKDDHIIPKNDHRAVLGRYWMVEALQHSGYPFKDYQRTREEAMRLDLIGI